MGAKAGRAGQNRQREAKATRPAPLSVDKVLLAAFESLECLESAHLMRDLVLDW